MYTLVKTIAKPKRSYSLWEDVNAGPMIIRDFLSQYRDAIFTVENPFLGGTVWFKLVDFERHGLNVDLSFDNWLTQVDNQYISGVSHVDYSLERKETRYRDAIQANYSWKHVNFTYAADASLPLSERPDLLLTRPNTSTNKMVENLLITVNGYFHRSSYHVGGLCVHSGGQTIVKSDRNSVGAWSFENVGGVRQIAIDETMIGDTDPGQSLWDGMLIKVGESLTNKTVFVSIGGSLHMGDDAYKVINDEEGIISIDFTRVNLMDRILTQKDYISLASLPFATTSLNRGAIFNSDLKKNAFLRAYMSLPQSFVVIIDDPDVYVKRHGLEYSGFPGVYYSYVNAARPILSHNGTFPEQWVRNERGVYVHNINHEFKINYVKNTTEWRGLGSVDNTRRIDQQYSAGEVMQIEVGVEKLTWD